MDADSAWGAMLVGWLLIAPLVAAVVSARWGGAETAYTYRSHRPLEHDHRMAHDNANVPPERVDYAATDRTFARDAARQSDYRDRGDPRGQPRH